MTTITIQEDIQGLEKTEFDTFEEAAKVIQKTCFPTFIPELPPFNEIENIEIHGSEIHVIRKDGLVELHAPMIDPDTKEVFDLNFKPISESDLSEEDIECIQNLSSENFIDT